ncbi:RNA polymerase sigma factor [Cohnella suwonensis]|uniref:RNA polymerase sigma factor n=1 Tax=Cohnella suwonensis TaxID=696072 RepID=A0ABW0M0V8_9BACL
MTEMEGRDVERMNAALSRYCLSLTESRWDAEDLAQETWAKTLGAKIGPNHLNPEALLLRIAKNTWIDRSRRYATLKRLLRTERSGDMSTSPDEGDLAAESAFEALMAAMPPLQRSAFLLRDVFGYSAVEAAALLRTTEGAVKAALHRARQALPRVRDALRSETPAAAKNEEAKLLLRSLAAAYRMGDVSSLLALVQQNDLEPASAIGLLRTRRIHALSAAGGSAAGNDARACAA